MKMVKSLLLVSAAGLVAASGAQAADLPVKAKPVEYVKVCSLYGAGFYYIPGTDICMKVGGYVRWQESVGAGSSISGGPFQGVGGLNNRTFTTENSQRSRVIASFDTRQQTAYGTLRTYVILGYSQDSVSGATAAAPATALYATRGFIQIAGFTFGKATSFFDFVSTAAVAYNAGVLNTPDTGDAGAIVAAYTAQLGNGVSASIAIEDTRRIGVVQTASNSAVVGAGLTGAQNAPYALATGFTALPTFNNDGGTTRPQDIVGNVRIDQAWGSAQVSAAWKPTAMNYYTGGLNSVGTTEGNGHAGNKSGWAASVGLRLNAPMFGPGDYFQGAFHYSEGAATYATGAQTALAGGLNHWSGSSMGFGAVSDGVTGFVNGMPGIELTTAWSVMASYEHFWTPALRTSLYGSYLDVSYNATATRALCLSGGAWTGLNTTNAAILAGSGSFAGCSPNWSSYAVGSRSQWNVTKDFYIGFDVTYLYLNCATNNNNGGANVYNGNTMVALGKNGGYTITNQEAWMATWRVHRDIVP